MHRVVFEHAKIVHVMEGRVRVETATGTYDLLPGAALALGTGRWCSMWPLPFARVWTLYFDEDFLRAQMSWVLPDATRVLPRVHPDSWDGTALVLWPGLDVLRRSEPLWRQISVVDQTAVPELTATRLIALFTRTVEFTLPTFLVNTEEAPSRDRINGPFPVKGTLTRPPLPQQVRQAVDLLRSRMAEPWTVPQLAAEVATSRTHLTRLFSVHVGVAPMRFLTEVRLTEFTRLIEETELPVSVAARSVGWVDGRIAAGWFRRRFGMSPSEYRAHPHPSCTEDAPGGTCRGVGLLPGPRAGRCVL